MGKETTPKKGAAAIRQATKKKKKREANAGKSEGGLICAAGGRALFPVTPKNRYISRAKKRVFRDDSF